MSSKNVYCHIFIIYFSLISNCLAESNDLPYKEGELLVRFAPKTHGIQRTKQEKDQFLSSLNAGEVKRSYNRVQGLTLVKLPEGHKVVDALSKFKGKSEILYVEPNYKIKLCSTTPNDPCFVYQWGMNNSGQSGGMLDADIDAPEAWEIIHDACDIIVAVTDTGICAHSDLAQNMWVNQAELNGIPYYDDDHNGYTDDIYGWDFSGPDPGDKDPNDYYNENGSLYFGHGTHVAGIIGARGNNGTGVTGVCWNVKIMNLKIFPNATDEGFIADAISAIEYAVDKGAKIINASWGGFDPNQALENAIEAANDANVLVIAAAGNGDRYGNPTNIDTNPHYPASYPCSNIISVMASNIMDGIADGSNFGGASVDLAAPGGDTWSIGQPGRILSTLPVSKGSYGYLHGTSMATP